jgi:hypothetical protein
LFSRTPDYFAGDFSKGVIVLNEDNAKQVQYSHLNMTYKIPIESWGASQVAKGQVVDVIFNPAIPSEASLYSFFAYWLKLRELIITVCVFAILFLAAVFINGKQETYYYSEEERRKKRKYKD